MAYLLDTNCLVYFIKNRLSGRGRNLVKDCLKHPRLSIVTVIELKSSTKDGRVNEFINAVLSTKSSIVYQADLGRMEAALIKLRQQKSLKLADAIIALTAIEEGLTLLTSDRDFFGIQGLKTLDPTTLI